MEAKKLRVLWVGRGDGHYNFKAVVRNQFDSLKSVEGIELFALPLEGKGPWLYVKNFFTIRQIVKKHGIQIIHAHYSFTAILCALTFTVPVVASLMGSDVIAKKSRRYWIVLFAKYFWKAVIVKSDEMKGNIGIEWAKVIPNGVDLNFFKPEDRVQAQLELGWDISRYHIVFPADPSRKEKNYNLLHSAVESLNDPIIEIHTMTQLTKSEVRRHYAAANLVTMTSLREGSPNAIKEALAMNKMILCTPVGDVDKLFEGVDGVQIVPFSLDRWVEALSKVMRNSTDCNSGRLKMHDLSAEKIANQIATLYFLV